MVLKRIVSSPDASRQRESNGLENAGFAAVVFSDQHRACVKIEIEARDSTKVLDFYIAQ